jgi:hypothetical protein
LMYFSYSVQECQKDELLPKQKHFEYFVLNSWQAPTIKKNFQMNL